MFKTLKVLLIGNTHMQSLERLNLSHLECKNVVGVETGKEALEKLETKEIDLIIIRSILPNENVFEIVEEIRKSKTMPILMRVDSFFDKKFRETAKKFGVSDFIEKPVTKEDLKAKIISMLKVL